MSFQEKVTKNIKYSIINYIVVNGFKFLTRLVFIKCLPIEYLGITGLFSNIFVLLSLTELGIGPAMVYSLYKPLAENDRETIKSIMRVFKRLYTFIGCVILLLGLIIYPWIDYLIKDNNIQKINYFYLIFLTSSVVSYFYSYKRSLLIADQKQYIINNYQSVVQILIAILQIISLKYIPNYWVYILLVLLGNIIENLIISYKADKEYIFLSEKSNSLNKNIQQCLVKNVKALIGHKIGSILSFSTSSLIISKFLGLSVVGIYSNYFMVLNVLNVFSMKLFEAVTASVGNLIITDSQEKQVKIFKLTEFLTALQSSVIFAGLYVLLNPFIILWIGKEYIFDEIVVSAMAFNFYLMYMRKGILMFRDAAGLYWQDRYKPIAEAIINLSVSIYCTIHYGVIGVAIGGIVGTMLTGFWIEPYILFKNRLNLNLQEYFIDFIKFVIVTLVGAALCKTLYDTFIEQVNIFNFILSIPIIVIIVLGIWILIFGSREEMKYIKNIMKYKIGSRDYL